MNLKHARKVSTSKEVFRCGLQIRTGKRSIEMSKKVLIMYSTRHGATESTSQEIAKVFQSEGLNILRVKGKKPETTLLNRT